MGQFSWIYSDTHKQLVDDKMADAWLLVPPEFQGEYGEAIYEPCYNGYGRFGGYDLYELIALWNKEMIPEIIEKIRRGEWQCGSKTDIPDLQNFYEEKPFNCELRWIGIVMACYDKDNARLKHPIKIVSKATGYEEVSPSLRDPKQGWEDEAKKTMYVTFSVSCTYTVSVDVEGDATEEEIQKLAWKKVNENSVSIGELENDDWELMQIDD